MYLEWGTGDVGPRAERAQQFELLIKNISDYAIFLLDPEGRVVTWNPGAERLKGYTEPEIVGESLARFYPEEDRAAGRYKQLLETARREGRVEDIGWRVRKDGSRFWADVVITAIRDERGELVGFGKVTRDLTDRKALEDRLAAQNAELQAADRMKDQFLSILSHELRTPLNAVLGFASILDDEIAGPLNERQHAYMGKIMGGTDVLLGLIDDLLDMSRIQAGKFALAPAPADVGAVVREAAAGLLALAEQKGQALRVDVPEDLPRAVVDAQRVAQVVVNLIGNAIKFTPAGGTVRVAARGEGDRLRVEIADDGPGVPAEHRERLFEPFYQVDASATRAAGGTGLGLGIAKALVEAHGGRIGLDDAEPHGACFWFELPLALQGAM